MLCIPRFATTADDVFLDFLCIEKPIVCQDRLGTNKQTNRCQKETHHHNSCAWLAFLQQTGDNNLVNSHSPLAAARQRWPSATITHVAGVNDTATIGTDGTTCSGQIYIYISV